MSTLADRRLTNCQALAFPTDFAPPSRPGMPQRLIATLRLWHARMRNRAELAALGERELRDMSASSADVWQEISQPFWRQAARN
ncbi:MAG TPA: DUF1127 domain-containing protein [Acetobacteraceae bacterium]|jgi:uncharacterized protein YjiS (DUF1127 family)